MELRSKGLMSRPQIPETMKKRGQKGQIKREKEGYFCCMFWLGGILTRKERKKGTELTIDKTQRHTRYTGRKSGKGGEDGDLAPVEVQ